MIDTPMRKRRPTIIDVAQHAGVSKSLASRALRGDAGVSAENRAKVEHSATELRYRPNSAARSLVRGVSGLIGVVLNEIGNQHHTEIVAGIEAHARTQNSRVIIGHGGHSASELRRQIDTMIELRVDGLIIVSSWVPHESLAHSGREVPTVLVTQIEDPPPVIDTIASDDIAGAFMATEHLLQTGARSIAYVTRSSSATSRARIKGVEKACQAAGTNFVIKQYAPQDSQALQEMITSRSFDAMLCNNDLTAAEVIRLARSEGIKVPEELSVIGYDNTPLAQLVYPSLSSIDQPQYLMGERASGAIFERINGRDVAVREFYTPSLVQRESSNKINAPETNQKLQPPRQSREHHENS